MSLEQQQNTDEGPSTDSDTVVIGDTRIELPPTADDEEAAAIVTAIGAHLSDQEQMAAAAAVMAAAGGRDWRGERWAFAGKLRSNGIGGRNVRVPLETPRDPWTAAGRADRF
ncbi:MAG: hypothetical protein ACI9PP_002021 [Halobacteriales archaeon]|jgi:hypothetical protein